MIKSLTASSRVPVTFIQIRVFALRLDLLCPDDGGMDINRRSWPKRLLTTGLATALLLLIVCGLLVGWVFASEELIGLDSTIESTVAEIRSWGKWGVLVSILLMIAHSFLPFPAEIIACANGVIYGPLWGAVITWVGAMLGAAVAFGLARLFGQPFVRSVLSVHQWQRITNWSEAHGGQTLLVSRLIPLIAFNLINYAAGLTAISWWTFLWATGLGILPLTLLLAVLGDRMTTLPLWVWLLIASSALLFSFFLHRRCRTTSPRKCPVQNGVEDRT